MKLYLIAGGMLLTAASVYGVTDYVQTKNKKVFKELYQEAPAATVKEITVNDIDEEDFSRAKIVAPPPVKEVTASEPVKVVKKKKTKKSVYASSSMQEELNTATIEPVKESSVELETKVAAKAPTKKKALKKRIALKKFSRAAPGEEVILEEKKQ